jgi:integrator complex subunit 9
MRNSLTFLLHTHNPHSFYPYKKMKIQCLDNKGTTPNTFLCKINQHTILVNCPLETLKISLPPNDQQEVHDVDEEEETTTTNDLKSILSSFSQQGKRTIDTQYSSLTTSLNNCDSKSVFRIAEFSLIDIHSIDLVLISNYDLMLGLPYLTEYMGYKGKIIATEPTVEYGKQRMEELVYNHGQNTTNIDPTSSTHFSQLIQEEEKGWKSIYTLKDVVSCIEKVQSVRYTEKLTLFSTLNIIGYSSGYCLGSTNWLLETSFINVAFLSNSTIYPNLHPAPFDYDLIKQANVIIVGGLNQQSEKELSFERAKQKLLVSIGRTIMSQHNIVIHTSAVMGIIFDLIGEIDNYFKSIGKEIGKERHQIPIYISNPPIADKSLKYANICGEWMNSGRHDLLYLPEMPLTHGQLLQSGAIKIIQLNNQQEENITLQEPCIVFTSDYSLFWYLNQWRKSNLNTCVFIDSSPAIPPLGNNMTFMKLPLDTRLKLEDIPSLLHNYWRQDTEKRHLLLPRIKGAELVKEEEENDTTQVYIYEQGEVLKINVNRDWEKVSVSEKVSLSSLLFLLLL